MKTTSTLVLSSIFVCFSLLAHAQVKQVPLNEPDRNKPKLFQNLPEKINVEAATLESMFSLESNRPAYLDIAGIPFQGNILSKSTDDVTSANTIVMQLSNYPGANLTVSKIIQEDGSTKFIGRIISFKHGDLYELQNQKGNWVLVKRNFYDLVNE
jgi:hypothetical protein